MANVEGKAQVSNFVGGLVTDFHELNQPQNTTVDEDNCDLDRKGSRRRRLGIDFEPGYEVSDVTWSTSALAGYYLGNQTWEAVNNDGSKNFLVVQIGPKLYYYDLSVDPVSSGLMPFTTDLTAHKFSGAVSDIDVAATQASITSGKGIIFVCGGKLTPFYVQYHEDTNTITEVELDVRVRDLKLQSGETDFELQPTSIDYKKRYDYFNQGWYITNMFAGIPGEDRLITEPLLDFYYTNYSHYTTTMTNAYPPLSKAWWIGQAAADGDKHNHIRFDISWYKTPYVGNLLAPLGHYIVDPFNIDRSSVSGVAGFTIEQSNDRPTAIAFYAGKVFYGWKNQILFSQTLIDDFGVAAKCYQSADPTAQDINNLVATDGGVIPLQYSGAIVTMVPFENSLLIFCTNGVWALGGGNIGSGFAADGFALYKISSVGALSSRSVVLVDGTPTWWSKIGIYMIASSQSKQGFSAENMLKDKAQLFYDAIPGVSKLFAAGAYDRLKKVIVWIFNGLTTPIDGNSYFCNRCLNFDTLLGAFFPYTLSDLSDLTPRVADVFPLFDVSTSTVSEDVVDALGANVVDALGADVTVNDTVIGNFDNQSNIGVKFLTFTKEIVSG